MAVSQRSYWFYGSYTACLQVARELHKTRTGLLQDVGVAQLSRGVLTVIACFGKKRRTGIERQSHK